MFRRVPVRGASPAMQVRSVAPAFARPYGFFHRWPAWARPADRRRAPTRDERIRDNAIVHTAGGGQRTVRREAVRALPGHALRGADVPHVAADAAGFPQAAGRDDAAEPAPAQEFGAGTRGPLARLPPQLHRRDRQSRPGEGQPRGVLLRQCPLRPARGPPLAADPGAEFTLLAREFAWPGAAVGPAPRGQAVRHDPDRAPPRRRSEQGG